DLQPSIWLSHTAFDFGEVFTDTSKTQNFWLGNTGVGDLYVTAARVTGADSSDFLVKLDSTQFTIVSGDSLEVPLTFAPSSEGAKTAVLQVSSNDLSQPTTNIQLQGTGKKRGPVSVVNHSETTIPQQFILKANYPNPFNAQTTIEYGLPKASRVQLMIFNVLGERIRTLLHHKQSAGFKKIQWDGKNDGGKEVSSGIYYLVLKTEQARLSLKMTLLK
ncbi:MAG: choice-of-anchor D domain-containing protein, partial [bacterium]